jgi:hypothetical protein
VIYLVIRGLGGIAPSEGTPRIGSNPTPATDENWPLTRENTGLPDRRAEGYIAPPDRVKSRDASLRSQPEGPGCGPAYLRESKE